MPAEIVYLKQSLVVVPDFEAAVQVTAAGPTLHYGGDSVEELLVMGTAMIDAARALRCGDDPAAVMVMEFERRMTRRRARALRLDAALPRCDGPLAPSGDSLKLLRGL